MSKWYLIKDLDNFVDHARSLVFKFFGTMNEESEDTITEALSVLSDAEIGEMDSVLSHEESALIIRNNTKVVVDPITKIESFQITDDILYKILEELNSRLVSNILSQLVQKGVLDSAFDSVTNDFIFWIKNDEENKDKKSETD